MTTEGFLGSLPASVLDALTTAMGIENKLGVAEDVRLGAPPRVTWVPAPRNGIRIEWAPFALPDRDVTSLRAMDFDVHFLATSYTELVDMVDQMSAQLDILIGPEMGQLPTIANDGKARAGYAFGAAGGVGPVQGAGVAGSWACVCPATLKEFVARRQLTTTAPIEDVPLTITSTDISGQNEQAGLASDTT